MRSRAARAWERYAPAAGTRRMRGVCKLRGSEPVHVLLQALGPHGVVALVERVNAAALRNLNVAVREHELANVLVQREAVNLRRTSTMARVRGQTDMKGREIGSCGGGGWAKAVTCVVEQLGSTRAPQLQLAGEQSQSLDYALRP